MENCSLQLHPFPEPAVQEKENVLDPVAWVRERAVGFDGPDPFPVFGVIEAVTFALPPNCPFRTLVPRETSVPVLVARRVAMCWTLVISEPEYAVCRAVIRARMPLEVSGSVAPE